MEADARPAVTIVGSVHMDLIATADRLPQRGETLPGHHFAMRPGGKGGNQAVQAALCGVHAFMVGRVGQDAFGDHLRQALSRKGVDATHLTVDREAPTGASTVLVGENGDYASVIVPGASGRLSPPDIDAARPAIAKSTVLLAQLEVSLDAVARAVAVAKDSNRLVILNAAPAPRSLDALPLVTWQACDGVVVNEVEAEMLSGLPCRDGRAAEAAGAALIERLSVPTVVITLGPHGALLVRRERARHFPGWPVDVVDTVGAGDAFVGTLASQLARGASLDDAVPIANVAGALAVTRSGAYDAMPSIEEVRAFLAAPRGRALPP